MTGWLTKRLSDVATLQRGFDLPNQDRIAGEFPLVSSSGISDTHHKGPVRGPGVVTGRSGSVGNAFFIEQDFWPLNTVLYVKDFHGNDPKFISYLLQKFDLRRFASGTGVPTLNRNSVHDQPVSVPTLSEQIRIVSILDEAFERIDTAVATIERNIENTRRLFDSFQNSFFTKNHGDWTEKKLFDVCHIAVRLVDPREDSYIDLPHIGAGNIVSKTGEIIAVKTAREEGLISGKFLFDCNTVLYSKIRPYLMKACRPKFNGLCSADVYPLVPDDTQIDRNFLFHILMSHPFTEYAISG